MELHCNVRNLRVYPARVSACTWLGNKQYIYIYIYSNIYVLYKLYLTIQLEATLYVCVFVYKINHVRICTIKII